MKKYSICLLIFCYFAAFKISFSAADVDCSDGSCTIPEEMFNLIKNKNTQLSKLDHAKAMYDTFGYVSEIVELAKSDSEAAKVLDSIKNELKTQADSGKAFEKMQLGQIYYLEGDMDNFRRYANPQHIKSIKMLSQAFGMAFEDDSLISKISDDQNNYNNISNLIFNSYMNIGNMELAKKMFESDPRFADNCNYGQVINMYANMYRLRNKEDIKDNFVRYLDSLDENQRNSDYVDGLLFILTDNDAKYENIAQKVREKINAYSPQRRCRILLDAANNLGANEISDKYLEEGWKYKILNDWEILNYANKIVYGSSRYSYNHEFLTKEVLKNPKIDTAIEILEDKYLDNINYVNTLLCIYKLKGDKDSYFRVIDNIIPRLTRPYELKLIAQTLLLPHACYYQDPQRAEKILETLNKYERGEIMYKIALSILNADDRVCEYSPSKALDYLYKALDYGYVDAFEMIDRYIDYDSAIALFDKYPDNKLIVFMKAMYLAENQKWEEAIKEFVRAREMGCNRATGILFGMKLNGLYKGDDKTDANAMLSEFLSKLGDPCSQTKLNNYGAKNNFKKIFGSRSNVMLEFYKEAAKTKKYSDWANNEITLYNLDMPILSDEKEALIKKRIKELEDENNRNLYPLISLYSDVFKNTPKALALYKKLADINFYDKITYAFKLFKHAYSDEDLKQAFDVLNRSNTDSEIQKVMVAMCYENGLGIEKDPKKAQEIRSKIIPDRIVYYYSSFPFGTPKQVAKEKEFYIQKMLKQVPEQSPANLKKLYKAVGQFYEKSPAPYKNPEKALEYYMKASEINPLYFDNVVRLYNSNPSLKDDKKYFDSLLKYKETLWNGLSNGSRAKLIYDIAFCHLNGRGTGKSPETAYALFKEIQKMPANNFTFNAMEAEAYCLQHGLGVKADPQQAEAIRKRIKEIALSNASPLTLYRAVRIAYMYNSQNLLGKDTDMYEYWANFAVNENPDKNIINGLYMLFTDYPKNRDMKKAQKYADLYAKYWGYEPKSLHRIGLFELFGINRAQNAQAGLELLKKAVSYENAAATETLAYAYEKGIGVEKDETRAKEYLDALRRLKPNYVSLADSYIRGRYGIEDIDRAKFILKLGADEGSEDAANNLKEFDSFLEKVRGNG